MAGDSLIAMYSMLNLLFLMIIGIKIWFTGDWPIKKWENSTRWERAVNWLFFPTMFIVSQLVDYGVRNSYRLDGYSYED